MTPYLAFPAKLRADAKAAADRREWAEAVDLMERAIEAYDRRGPGALAGSDRSKMRRLVFLWRMVAKMERATS